MIKLIAPIFRLEKGPSFFLLVRVLDSTTFIKYLCLIQTGRQEA